MKQYMIYALEKYGVFNCKEETQENGEVFLIGQFENKKEQRLFIKHSKDKLINQN